MLRVEKTIISGKEIRLATLHFTSGWSAVLVDRACVLLVVQNEQKNTSGQISVENIDARFLIGGVSALDATCVPTKDWNGCTIEINNMQWNKLKTMDCPSCYKPLSKNLLGYVCTGACGFQIGRMKFDKTIESLYKRKSRPVAQSEEESLSELNNLGHEEVSEDFSDRQPDL